MLGRRVRKFLLSVREMSAIGIRAFGDDTDAVPCRVASSQELIQDWIVRILHLIAGPGAGGAEVYVKDLAKALREMGHEMHVAFWGGAKDFGRSEEFERKFLAELKESGVRYFFVGYRSRRRPWIGICKIRQYVAENRIDIYHCHFLNGILYGCLLSVPKVYTHHNIDLRASKLQYRFLNYFVDAYVGISKVCAEALATITSRPVTLIMNGVDVRKFSAKFKKRCFLEEKLRIIAVGRLTPQKNLFHLVDVVASLDESTLSKVSIEIAGEGDVEYRRRLESYIEANKLSGKIALLGNQSDVPSLLARSHVLVMTSDWEGLPIALIESTVMGLPCVVTDVGGCREVVEICGNGIVVPARDVASFRRAVEALVADRELLVSMSKNAETARDAFEITVSAKNHVELYERLIGRRVGL